jgi:hypothetical protein
MSAPKWSVNMQRIAPGCYVDREGALHLDAREMCEAAGYPANAHNMDMLEKAARELATTMEVKSHDPG